MKIKTVEFRNVLSYGNRVHRLDFSTDPNGFYAVLGENGSGKTAIVESVVFGLYDRGCYKKKGEIPNWDNGNAWVRVVVEARGREVVVERGAAPNIFRLWVDGKEVDRAGRANLQAYLEDEVLGIPFYIFTNTISLSVKNFRSFLHMSAGDKRAIIDKIFGLQVLNQMRDMVRQAAKGTKDALDALARTTQEIQRSIDSSTQELERLLARIEEQGKVKREEVEAALSKLREGRVGLEGKLQEWRDTAADHAAAADALREEVTAQKQLHKEAARRVALYSVGKCPTCETDFNTDFYQSLLAECQSQMLSAKAEADALSRALAEKASLQREAASKQEEAMRRIGHVDARLRALESELAKLDEPAPDSQTQSIQSLIQEAQDRLRESEADRGKEERRAGYLRVVDEMLSEKGVKQLAIRSIIPGFNAQLGALLRELNVPFRVVFNEEWDAQVTSRGKEVGVGAFSVGEGKKVDFAILMALLRMMKMKFPGVNVLFLDEVFSSIDEDGRFQILKILGRMVKEMGLHTLVMNHAVLPLEVFDYKVSVEKRNGFSHMTVEKIR